MIDRSPVEIEAAVSWPFVNAGAEIDVECVEPDALEQAIAKASRSNIDVLLVGGGDGSVREAARHLMDKPAALGILPLGTFNRLARDLSIPLDLQLAAEALAKARTIAMDVGFVNDKIFLCNSLIGLPLHFTEERAALRGKNLGMRMSGYLRVVRAMLASTRRIMLRLDDGQGERAFRAISVAVSNNAYDEAANFMFRRHRVDAGELALYVSTHETGLRMAIAILRAMFGRWKGDPNIQHLRANSIFINSRRRRVKVSNDGEVETMRLPLRYSIKPKSLRVLTPFIP
ncbi:MAG: hypothetical protein KDJ37_01695 [Hyphomicrobiaceae bacterium]|nr:hypothetical protein [Hyphomicrobiaceae bacterium]